MTNKEQEIRVRITKEELSAIFEVAHLFEGKYYSTKDVINWNSFISKLKRFFK